MEKVKFSRLPLTRIKSFSPHRIRKGSRQIQPGLSLIESMVAITILLILAGLSPLNLSDMWNRHQLNTAVSDVRGQLEFYRMKSILEKSTCRIKLNPPFMERFIKVGSNWKLDERYRLADHATYTFSHYIYFYDSGFTSPKSIIISVGSFRGKIVININGRIRIQKLI